MREIERELTMKPASEYLGVSVASLKQRAFRGTIPALLKKGQYFFKITDLVDTIDSENDWINAETGELVTLRETAIMLRVDKQTLWARLKAGRNPRYAGKCGRLWMFRLSDVIAAGGDPDLIAKTPKNRKPTEYINTHSFPTKKITAKCPFCSCKHTITAPKGSTKWIYCKAHETLRHRSTTDQYRSILHLLAY